jgi:hypothetical protein
MEEFEGVNVPENTAVNSYVKVLRFRVVTPPQPGLQRQPGSLQVWV